MAIRHRDSVVGIVTGCRLDDRRVGVLVTVGSRILSMSSMPALGPTQPPSPGVKRQGHEAGHLPPSSSEVKKMWIYTSIPSYAFTGTTLPYYGHNMYHKSFQFFVVVFCFNLSSRDDRNAVFLCYLTNSWQLFTIEILFFCISGL
jgi:hypothetical protein